MNYAIELGKELSQIDFKRSFNLALIAGQLGRSHITSEGLRDIEKDNADTFTELYNRFVYETKWPESTREEVIEDLDKEDLRKAEEEERSNH